MRARTSSKRRPSQARGGLLRGGKIVLDGEAGVLKDDVDIREFYLGIGKRGGTDYRQVKHYRRRKRWLS